jgi:diguanylate cyclase
METRLRRALENNELEIHYQPKFDRRDRPIGLEALLRWRHPTLGLITPQKFIPIAEESGLIVPIGEWVLRESCRHSRMWQVAGSPPIKIAVNVSALQFLRTDFVYTVSRCLTENNLQPQWLEIEITETLLMQNAGEVASRLAQIRAMGVTIAIDDFGTGYSSLAYLQRLPIDTLKIDRSFVSDIGTDQSRGNAIINAIVGLGRNLNMTVVAEGVETMEQRDALLRAGCDAFQGFLYGMPADSGNARVLVITPPDFLRRKSA